MLLNICKISKFVMPDKAETGSAGEQPARNNPAGWNGLMVGIFPTPFTQTIPVIYALKNLSLLHFFLSPFVRFTLVQYNIYMRIYSRLTF